MYFIEHLIQLIKEKKSVISMGLDPRMEKEGEIPQYLINEIDNPDKIILEFNKSLIENTFELIPDIKPQIAFYEKYEALSALKETIKYAYKKDLLVILILGSKKIIKKQMKSMENGIINKLLRFYNKFVFFLSNKIKKGVS